jgi:hypothetical protein
MRLSPSRLLLPALLLLGLSGCGTTRSCGGNEDYLKAEERPLLQLPPSMVASERIKPIVVPPLAPDPQKLDPEPRCLDFPPPFFGRKPPAAKPAAPAVSTPPPAPAAPAASDAPPEPKSE